ncbi:MAG: Gfo/Idh/MocA family protein [Planctomycetota bacterium]|jgi:predicted dehydrogenase
MIKFAVVGAGYWGPNLIRNVVANPTAQLEMVCDLDDRKLAKIKEAYPGLYVTKDLDEVLAADEIDAVINATASENHHAIGKQVLEKGKHLFVEKPMALNSRDAQEMITLARDGSLTLMVGHTFEYNAAVRKVKSLMDEGELGEIYYLYSQRVNLGRIRTDCNAMWNLAPHDISISNFLLGESPVWVRADGYQLLDTGQEDVVFMSIGYPGNRVSHIHVSWLDPNKVRKTTIVGSKKMVVYDDVSTNAKVQVYDMGVSKVSMGVPSRLGNFGEFLYETRTGDAWFPKIDFKEPLREEIAHFVHCIQTGEPPISYGENGLRVVRVLEAAHQSIQDDGEVIDL